MIVAQDKEASIQLEQKDSDHKHDPSMGAALSCLRGAFISPHLLFTAKENIIMIEEKYNLIGLINVSVGT